MRRAGLALLAVGLLTSGCGGFLRPLGQREVVVHFAVNAPRSDHAIVRSACTGIPNVTPEPVPRSTSLAARLNDVRFRVDKANDVQLARLFSCLGRQPGVVGFDIPSQ